MSIKEQIEKLRKPNMNLLTSDERVILVFGVMQKAADSLERQEDRIKELEADNESLREGRCRWNCATAKEAFMAGFDAGAEDAADSGVIICDDFKKEVTNKAYKEWREKG